MRLIYYAVSFTADGKYDRQWIQSIRSLRAHNSHVVVWLFVFERISVEVTDEAKKRSVVIVQLGNYAEWLTRRHIRGREVAEYPTLGNFLVLKDAACEKFAEVLYIDCDTFFFDDPEMLFDQHNESDWYGREIPGTRYATRGRSSNFDEELMTAITAREHLQPAIPFNTGICLLNRNTWRRFVAVEHDFLDFAWRLMVGMQRLTAEAPDYKSKAAPRPGTDEAMNRLRMRVVGAASGDDLRRALPYPSDNWWILDEIACLLAIGKMPSVSQGLFSPGSVMQGDEFKDALSGRYSPVVVHYFSSFEEDFFKFVRRLD